MDSALMTTLGLRAEAGQPRHGIDWENDRMAIDVWTESRLYAFLAKGLAAVGDVLARRRRSAGPAVRENRLQPAVRS